MVKKILVVAPYSFLPFRSGGQKYIAQFLDALAQQVSVSVVSTPQDPGYTPSQHYRLLPVLPYSFFRYADYTLKATLIDLIERNHYDWIIWEHPYYGWLANIIKEKTGIKTLLHTHNIEYLRFRSLNKIWWPLLMPYERNTFKQADKIGFITEQDKQFAIKEWQIDRSNCLDIPYGITQNNFPEDKAACKNFLLEKHQLSNDQTLLLFNGALDYPPNYAALWHLLKEIMPRLHKENKDRYTLLICGKGLPKKDRDLLDYRHLGVIYAGFVDDISPYFKGADIFLNPVLKGGGIKTKMIESIAYGTPVVAMRTAATGLFAAVAGPMLIDTPDRDWDRFAEAVQKIRNIALEQKLQTPPTFYAYYNWSAIIDRLLANLSN